MCGQPSCAVVHGSVRLEDRFAVPETHYFTSNGPKYDWHGLLLSIMATEDEIWHRSASTGGRRDRRQNLVSICLSRECPHYIWLTLPFFENKDDP